MFSKKLNESLEKLKESVKEREKKYNIIVDYVANMARKGEYKHIIFMLDIIYTGEYIECDSVGENLKLDIKKYECPKFFKITDIVDEYTLYKDIFEKAFRISLEKLSVGDTSFTNEMIDFFYKNNKINIVKYIIYWHLLKTNVIFNNNEFKFYINEKILIRKNEKIPKILLRLSDFNLFLDICKSYNTLKRVSNFDILIESIEEIYSYKERETEIKNIIKNFDAEDLLVILIILLGLSKEDEFIEQYFDSLFVIICEHINKKFDDINIHDKINKLARDKNNDLVTFRQNSKEFLSHLGLARDKNNYNKYKLKTRRK